MSAAAPTRKVHSQWGYRIRETGVEWWGYLDIYYDGGNSAKREAVEKQAQAAINSAAALGFTATAEILRRDHLTTTWSRLLKPEATGQILTAATP